MSSTLSDVNAFADKMSRLIALYRLEPMNGEAQAAALGAALRVVSEDAVTVEAGLEVSDVEDHLSLKARLLARQVDHVQVLAGAPAEDLAALARALSDDVTPIPSTTMVRVEMVQRLDAPQTPAPLPLAGDRSSELVFLDRPGGQPRRERRRGSRLGPVREIEELTAAVQAAIERGQWMEGIHAAQALIHLSPRIHEDSRRSFSIAVKRRLPSPVLRQFIEFAVRVPEEQARVAEILRWIGYDAVEVMIESIGATESATPRQFLHDALSDTPSAFPMVLALLSSTKPYQVRHGAELMGRLQNAEGIPALKGLLTHPDGRVRAAALWSLSEFPDPSVVDTLRQALQHPSAHTRAVAGRAIGRRRNGALAMPLVAALNEERDPDAWHELLTGLGEIDAPEATAALTQIALEKRSFLRRRGQPLERRLEAVRVLGESSSPAARQALEHLAVEGDPPIRAAAEEMLLFLDGVEG